MVFAPTPTTALMLTHGKVRWVTFKCLTIHTKLLFDGADTKTPVEVASSPTPTPRASYFPQAQAADRSTKEQPVSPVPELIPDIFPIAVRRCGPPSILEIGENIPPRPFSTPPRISSRAEADVTWVALFTTSRPILRSTHPVLITRRGP